MRARQNFPSPALRYSRPPSQTSMSLKSRAGQAVDGGAWDVSNLWLLLCSQRHITHALCQNIPVSPPHSKSSMRSRRTDSPAVHGKIRNPRDVSDFLFFNDVGYLIHLGQNIQPPDFSPPRTPSEASGHSENIKSRASFRGLADKESSNLSAAQRVEEYSAEFSYHDAIDKADSRIESETTLSDQTSPYTDGTSGSDFAVFESGDYGFVPSSHPRHGFSQWSTWQVRIILYM